MDDLLKKTGFKSERVKLSYKIPSKGWAYNFSKNVFNFFAMDSFLNYIANKI